MMNRGTATGVGDWVNLPMEKQMGFKIPIDIMLDLPYLRQHHNVITVKEFLLLHNLDPLRERTDGYFDREYYLGGQDGGEKLTLHTIQNHLYDPSGFVIVDLKAPLENHGVTPGGPLSPKLWSLMENKDFDYKDGIGWEDARNALKDHLEDFEDDDEFERLLHENGWTAVYTFDEM